MHYTLLARIAHRFTAAVLAALLLMPQPALADLAADRERFEKAWKALRAGNLSTGRKLGEGLEHYPLYPYLKYEDYRRRLHRIEAQELRRFLSAHERSWVGDRLRTRWLELLARRRDWQGFIDDYRPQASARLRCQHLLARIETGATEAVVRDALPLWLVGESQEPECDPAFELLYASPLMNDELLWQRIRLAMEQGNGHLAAYLGRKLTPQAQPWVALWRLARADPARAMRAERLAAGGERAREILAYAVKRLARRDLDAAAAQWQTLQARHAFSAAEKSRVYRALGRRADFAEHEQAIELLARAGDLGVDAATQRARLRAALRERDFATLREWTRQEAAPDMNPLRWQYWRARALEETGKPEAARLILRRLSQERDYYGFLAADRLGVGYEMNDYPIDLAQMDRDRLMAIPGIARARELYEIGMTFWARREWYHTSGQLEPAQLEHAAALAHELGWHDRAIITAAKSGHLDDLALRFPMPFEALVAQYAEKRELPMALLYGIIKSESAFMEDARSPAGALGLMQVMPGTGRETARRIGMRYTGSRQLLRAKPNITLGSAYLKRLLDRYEGNIAMAAAGYNAGPHRVRAWKPAADCESAELWIEQIPFLETRRYVRRALFFTAVYEWRMAQTVQTIRSRLAQVPSRQGRAGECGLAG